MIGPWPPNECQVFMLDIQCASAHPWQGLLWGSSWPGTLSRLCWLGTQRSVSLLGLKACATRPGSQEQCYLFPCQSQGMKALQKLCYISKMRFLSLKSVTSPSENLTQMRLASGTVFFPHQAQNHTNLSTGFLKTTTNFLGHSSYHGSYFSVE